MSLNHIAGMSCNLLSGLLFLIGFILLIQNKGQIHMENLIIIFFLASIAIGVHGLGHHFGNDFTAVIEKQNNQDDKSRG
jgi:hypothetical protein